MVTENGCRLELTKLTLSEKAAVAALREHAIKRAWVQVEHWPENGATVMLNTALPTVRSFLAKQLKPERSTLSAVRFHDGTLEEVHTAELVSTGKKPPKAGVTVAEPARGCPQPAFERAELKATRVLEAFLSSEQLADFRRHNCFVTVGVDTGRRYLVKSRHQPDFGPISGYLAGNFFGQPGKVAYASLIGLDEPAGCPKPLCVHDWSVPAPEEMLAIHCYLSLPGRERYIVTIPEEPV